MSVSSKKINNPNDVDEDHVKEFTLLNSAEKNTAQMDLKKDKSGDNFKKDKTYDGAKMGSPRQSGKKGIKIVDAQNVVEMDTKTPTMQHLLSDWRTAMSNQPRVKQSCSQSIESSQRDKRIGNQKTVYASQDKSQLNAMQCNKSLINQEFRFMSEEVKLCIFSY